MRSVKHVGPGTVSPSQGTITTMRIIARTHATHRRIRRRRPAATAVAAVAVFASLLLVPPASAASEPLQQITASGIYPAFSPTTTDYALRQCDNRSVTFRFKRHAQAALTVDGDRVRATTLTRRLSADRVLTVKARYGKVNRTWYVRCLPDDFPRFSTTVYRPGGDGLYLLATGRRPDVNTWALHSAFYVILDRNGVPLWYMRAEGSPSILDRAPNGNLYSIALPEGLSPSYGGREGNAVVETTLSGSVVRKIATPAGDPIDMHALQVLPDGHLLLLTMPVVRGVDLSAHFRQLVPLDVGGGGTAQCDVTAVSSVSVAYPSIRELDRAGNVVWSWDGKDHLDPGETLLPAVSDIDHTEGTDCVVDLFHGNWASRSADSRTVVLTNRFASATYGIDRESGEILWKVGGVPTAKSLQIVGDPYGERGPAGQHGGALDEQGRLTVFDNRRIRSEVARGVLYQLDTDARTATYVRGYEPPVRPCENTGGELLCISQSMGNTQHLPSGGMLVSWGFRPGSPNVATVFDGQGRPVVAFHNSTPGQVSYHVTAVPAGAWNKAALRAAASSRRSIPAAWESGLTWEDAPTDAAGAVLR